MSLKWPNKDPDDFFDYSIDWSRFLGSETISSVVWSIVDENDVEQTWIPTNIINNLQLISATNNNTVATIQIGMGTNHTVYDIFCEITMSPSNAVAKRNIKMRVQEQ